VSLLSCLASVVQGSASGGFPCDTLGGRPEMKFHPLSDILVAKAPALGDRCGAGFPQRVDGFVSEVTSVLGDLLPGEPIVATGDLSSLRVPEPAPGSVVVVLLSDFVRCSSDDNGVEVYDVMARLGVTRTIVVHSGSSAMRCFGPLGTRFVAVEVSSDSVPRLVGALYTAGNYVGAVEVSACFRDGTPDSPLWADLYYNSARIGGSVNRGLQYAMLSGRPSMRDLSYLAVCEDRIVGPGDPPFGPTVRQLSLLGFDPDITRLCLGSGGSARVCLSYCESGAVGRDVVIEGWHVA